MDEPGHPLAGQRVLVTGGAGLLGRALLAAAPSGLTLHATQRRAPAEGARPHRVELASQTQVAALFAAVQPHLVIHTAATMHAGEQDILAATRHVVAGCAATGAALLHLSTDALFDGEHAPYREADEPAPIHDYGRWKAEAEQHVRARLADAAVVRTSLITRFAPLDPRSAWVATSLRLGNPIALYVDELRCPIALDDIARQLWEIAALPTLARKGVWHLAGPEAISRYGLGLLIALHQRLDPTGLTPARSASAASPRPRDVRLLTARADQTLRTRARPVSALLLDS